MKKFQRAIENFRCDNCSFFVAGNGYTNHCPKCLWSKHVDVNPGDRAEICQGLMKPLGVEQKSGKYTIIHKCENCGFEKKNKTVPEDDFEQVIKLTK